MDGRVATRRTNARPHMEQPVISAVLTDDQPRIGILGVSVNVMHFRRGRQRSSKGAFGALSMQQFRRTDA